MYVEKGKFLEAYNEISSVVATYGGDVVNSSYSKGRKFILDMLK